MDKFLSPHLSLPRIHPSLGFPHKGHSTQPSLLWDITLHPSTARGTQSRLLPYLHTLSESATSPPQPHLTLQCVGLPLCRISASSMHIGVTVRDLLEAFYVHLRVTVSQEQFLSLSTNDRRRVTVNFENRTRRHPEHYVERLKGLKLVDLVQGVQWLGLTATGPDILTVNLA
jgi:hypothetical protein